MLAKSKLNRIEVLFSKALIDSNISHDKFDLINNVLKELDKMKEAIKNLKTLTVHTRFQSIYKTIRCIASRVEKLQKVKIWKFQGQKTEE